MVPQSGKKKHWRLIHTAHSDEVRPHNYLVCIVVVVVVVMAIEFGGVGCDGE
jgi:hypothetical protein